MNIVIVSIMILYFDDTALKIIFAVEAELSKHLAMHSVGI